VCRCRRQLESTSRDWELLIQGSQRL